MSNSLRSATLSTLLLVVALSCSPTQGSKAPTTKEVIHPPDECGPEWSSAEIMDFVKKAVALVGDDPDRLEQENRLTINEDGCFYSVLGVYQPETIPAEFYFRFHRSGWVQSWP